MSEKTLRAELPMAPLGRRIERLAAALLAIPAGVDQHGHAYAAWSFMSVPAMLAPTDYQGDTFGFVADCHYEGDETGVVLAAIVEEQVGHASPPFQQIFVGFIDCGSAPPLTLSPFDLFDPIARRAYVRDPMWTVPPAELAVARSVASLSVAWAQDAMFGPHGARAFEWVSGHHWQSPENLDIAGI